MGRAHWIPGTLRLILSNPCYMGMAYANRIRMRAATHRRSALAPIGPGIGWCFRPPEEWIGIPVPAIIDAAVFQRVQARLATKPEAGRNGVYNMIISCAGSSVVATAAYTAQGGIGHRPTSTISVMAGGHQAKACMAHAVRRSISGRSTGKRTGVGRSAPGSAAPGIDCTGTGTIANGRVAPRRTTAPGADAAACRAKPREQQRERLLQAYLASVIELEEFERRQRELVQQMEDLQGQERQLAVYSAQLLNLGG